MLQRTFLMRYYIHQNTHLLDLETMLHFLIELANLGHTLTTFTQPGAPSKAQKSSFTGTADSISVSGISTALQNDLALFVTGKISYLWILAIPKEQNSFKCAIAFQASSSICSLAITLEHIGFTTSFDESMRIFEHWLALFQLFYRTWQPIYAHSFVPTLNWSEPDPADLRAGHIPYLYEINFLGPDLVESIGKERLLSTPLWKIETLRDGGVLLIPEFIFASRDPHVWIKATQHLNMPQSFWTRYVSTPNPV